jgi:hypothetical protein
MNELIPSIGQAASAPIAAGAGSSLPGPIGIGVCAVIVVMEVVKLFGNNE